MLSKASALPGKHRGRLNDNERILPPGPHPRQPSPKDTICRLEPRSFLRKPINSKLVSQGEHFEFQGTTGAELGSSRGQKSKKDGSHNRTVATMFRGCNPIRGDQTGPELPCDEQAKTQVVTGCFYFRDPQAMLKEGRSLKEVSGILGVSRATLRRRLREAGEWPELAKAA